MRIDFGMLSLPAGGDSQYAGEHPERKNLNSTVKYEFAIGGAMRGLPYVKKRRKVLVH
jgi:hypothetical protein